MTDENFKQLSRNVWDNMAAGWDERHAYIEQSARAVAERMLEVLDPQPGQVILDLAAGTGIVGFAAANAAEKVIVSDFAPLMVEAAEKHAASLGLTNVECRVLDAEALALDDNSVDGVLCRWGYMLMGDPATALRETRRVLRPGGTLSVAVFSTPENNPWVVLPTKVLRDLGHMAPPAPNTPGILALGEGNKLRELLTGAGFTDVVIEPVTFAWSYANVDEYWEFLIDAAGAIAAVINRLSIDDQATVRREIEANLPDPITFHAESLVACAK